MSPDFTVERRSLMKIENKILWTVMRHQYQLWVVSIYAHILHLVCEEVLNPELKVSFNTQVSQMLWETMFKAFMKSTNTMPR